MSLSRTCIQACLPAALLLDGQEVVRKVSACVFVRRRTMCVLRAADMQSHESEYHMSVAGLACVPPSCPQFIVMGPLFHFLKDTGIEVSPKGASVSVTDLHDNQELLQSAPLAVVCSSFAESTISYPSQTINARVSSSLFCAPLRDRSCSTRHRWPSTQIKH